MLSKCVKQAGKTFFSTKNLLGVQFYQFSGAAAEVDSNKQGFLISTKNRQGSLSKILDIFAKNGINLTYIESQLLNKSPAGVQEALFSIEIEHCHSADLALNEIRRFANVVEKSEVPVVPWFPTKLSDLDLMGGVLQERDDEGGRDHPLFKDHEYKKRRDEIAAVSRNTKMSDPIPTLDYTPKENATWKAILEKIVPMHKKYMCKQYLECYEKLQKNCGLSENYIPQLNTIDAYLRSETGFRLKPTHGILSQREFLNALAFGVFCCTQYIRHHENPLYTPEPDIVHELIGHVPMFVDKTFCDMSQTIGLLSLGASEEDIAKLGAVYWYTVEFGACKEGDEVKAYGAGIASSIGEMEHFGSGKPKFEELDPFKNLRMDFPVQTVQPIYMVANSFKDAQFKLIEFGEYLKRPFRTWYDYEKNEVQTDRKVATRKAEEKSPLF